MRTRGRIRPGKANSLMGVVAGIGVLVFALSSGLMSEAPAGFGIVFVLIAILRIVSGLVNAFSTKGLATELVEFESEEISGDDDIDDRLRRLKDLRAQRLVSEVEYSQKRSELLAEL